MTFKNHVGQLLDYHCKSKDDDFGFHTLPLKEMKSYDFIIFNTYIKCNFWWGKTRGQTYFEGYEMYNNGEWGLDVGWAITENGFYRYDKDIRKWEYIYQWR